MFSKKNPKNIIIDFGFVEYNYGYYNYNLNIGLITFMDSVHHVNGKFKKSHFKYQDQKEYLSRFPSNSEKQKVENLKNIKHKGLAMIFINLLLNNYYEENDSFIGITNVMQVSKVLRRVYLDYWSEENSQNRNCCSNSAKS